LKHFHHKSLNSHHFNISHFHGVESNHFQHKLDYSLNYTLSICIGVIFSIIFQQNWNIWQIWESSDWVEQKSINFHWQWRIGSILKCCRWTVSTLKRFHQKCGWWQNWDISHWVTTNSPSFHQNCIVSQISHIWISIQIKSHTSQIKSTNSLNFNFSIYRQIDWHNFLMISHHFFIWVNCGLTITNWISFHHNFLQILFVCIFIEIQSHQFLPQQSPHWHDLKDCISLWIKSQYFPHNSTSHFPICNQIKK
jgi:hypothetical protein